MSIRRKTLVATTALTLSMSAAYASDNNRAFLEQNGTDNDALIEQTGSNNSVGSPNETNDMNGNVGISPRHIATQNGDRNNLDILQAGDGNEIGNRTGESQGYGRNTDGFGLGLDQIGNDNTALIEQLNQDNLVVRVQQIDGNSLTITQDGASDSRNRESNRVRTVYQENTGGTENSATVYQYRSEFANSFGGDGGANRLGPDGGNNNRQAGGIYQIGTGNIAEVTQGENAPGNARNALFWLEQFGANNFADVDQIGDHNFIDRITQTSTGVNGNSAIIYLEGEENGNTPPNSKSFAAAFTGGSKAEASGASASSVLQTGDNNSVDLMVVGNRNQFGFTQLGDNNSVGKITITGDDNELGVYQDSTGFASGNELALGSVDGFRNDIGVRQIGDNFATVNLTNISDDNIVSVDQTGMNVDASIDIDGDSNNIMLTQGYETGDGVTGGVNDADIDVTGNFNSAMIEQYGTNTLDLDITGDENGGFNSFTALTDAASIGLTAGSILQDGASNSITHAVFGPSDGNSFAFTQLGDSNTIVGEQTGAGSHQVAVLQVGNSNTANFSQVGSGNNAGISQ